MAFGHIRELWDVPGVQNPLEPGQWTIANGRRVALIEKRFRNGLTPRHPAGIRAGGRIPALGHQTASRTNSSNCRCKSWLAEARKRPEPRSICPPSGDVTTPPASRINNTPAAISQILVENPHNTPNRPAATSHKLRDAEPVRRTPWQRKRALLNTSKSGESGWRFAGNPVPAMTSDSTLEPLVRIGRPLRKVPWPVAAVKHSPSDGSKMAPTRSSP